MITYTDTSFLLKLVVDDEEGIEAAQRLWFDSDHLVCAEIGYVEARAALAAAHRSGRFDAEGLDVAKAAFDDLWAQLDLVPVTTALLAAAGDIAEREGLRGYDAVHLTAAIETKATVMASADRQLLAAAARHGIDTADPTTSPRNDDERGGTQDALPARHDPDQIRQADL